MTTPAGELCAPALPLASLARRLAALAYEILLLTALVFVASFALLPLVSPGRAGDALTVPAVPARAMLFCAIFAVAALYCVWSWTDGRRTLPQKTWRMRLVDADGRALTYRRAFVRYLAGWIGPLLALVTYVAAKPHGLGTIALAPLALSYLAAFVDPERQFLHDRVAGTRVVDAPPPCSRCPRRWPGVRIASRTPGAPRPREDRR